MLPAHLCASGCSWPRRCGPRSRGSRRRRSPGGCRAPGRTSARPRRSSLRHGRRVSGGGALRTPCPSPPGGFGGRSHTGGVLTLIGGHGTVAGAEARGAHAAVGDEGDAQEVGVGVEGRGHHVAAEPGGSSRRWHRSPPPPPPGGCRTPSRVLPGGAPPGRGRIRAAGPLLLVELQAVEEAGRGALHAERLHPQLDGEAGGHLDAPDAERVGRVGAGVVGGAEGALGAPQGPTAGCAGTNGTAVSRRHGTSPCRRARDLPGGGVLAVGSWLRVGVAAVWGAGGGLGVGAAVVVAVPWAGRAAAGELGGRGDLSSAPRGRIAAGWGGGLGSPPSPMYRVPHCFHCVLVRPSPVLHVGTPLPGEVQSRTGVLTVPRAPSEPAPCPQPHGHGTPPPRPGTHGG